MKTSEFIKRVEGLGYQTYACEFRINVTDRFGLKGTVFTKDFKISLSTTDFKLIKICVEYTETPIHEREEEKRYTVVLPDHEDVGLTKHALFRNGAGEITIGCTHIYLVHTKKEYHLTEAEIKRNHEYLWQFAKEVVE